MKTDLESFKYFMIVDLEATCCDKNTVKRNEMEIIEIGAVMVYRDNLKIIDEFQTFVKPVRKPVLTEFCTSLTSIRQEDVDSAPLYPEAVNIFKKWFTKYENFIFCSWGDYDKHQFEKDSAYHKISYPIGAKHVNIKIMFSERNGFKKRFGMQGALNIAKLDLKGTHHRAIDDVRNMAQLMPFILGRKSLKQ